MDTSSREHICTRKDEYSSESIEGLADALAHAQGEYGTVSLNRENPYFKSGYADLDAIMKAVRPSLTKYGLAFIQQTKIDDKNRTVLHTKLLHKSGQWIESRNILVLSENHKIQEYGSALSYNKRYAASALLGIAVSQDADDDDAETVVAPSRSIPPSILKITRNQFIELEESIKELNMPLIAENIINKMNIKRLEDLPQANYPTIMSMIKDLKAKRFTTEKESPMK